MDRRKSCLAALVLPVLFCGCVVSCAARGPLTGAVARDQELVGQNIEIESTENEASESVGAVSAIGAILLYLPNRIFDLLEIVRFGVNVGPGIGIDAQVTGIGQATLMSRSSFGVGFQGLRHLPVSASTEAVAAVGPLRADASLGPGWHRSAGDVRLEPHLILAGAHIAIDFFAIGDFFAGLLGFDPSDDDFGL